MKKIFRQATVAAAVVCTLLLAPCRTAVKADGATGAPSQPTTCATFTANGYLFDSTYQSEGYVGGLLNIHLKLLPKYADGRNWALGFYLYAADCSSQYVQASTPGFSFPPGDLDYSIRFTTVTHYEILDDDTGEQIDAGPLAVDGTWATDLPAAMADGTPYTQVAFNGFVAGGDTSVTATSAPVTGTDAPQRDPVIIVPGILGTVLQDQDVTLWPNLASMLLDPTSSFMDPLSLNASGVPIDSNVFASSVLDKIDYKFGTFHYSDSLVALLQANGYTMNQSLFVFPYDWRLSPKDAAVQLGTEISTVLTETGAQKVDIVAHSLGGLVLKQYLNNIHASNPAAEQRIGKVVFVAVPNLGSAEAAKALIFGSNFGVPLLSEAEVQKLATNMPSIYSLLPSADYYNYIAGFYDDLANPKVGSILNHDQAESLLLGLGKNASLLTAADAFHSTALDEFDFSSRPYSAYNVVGCGVFTLKTIDRMYSGTGSELTSVLSGPKYRIYADSGDGTVLVQSASHLAVPAGNTYYVNGAQHASILSNTAAESQILEILAGQPIETAPGVTQSSSACMLNGKLISYNQDMDITITDVTTNTSVDPSSFPSEDVDTGKNIFIPTGTGQVYVVTLAPQPAPAQTEAQSGSTAPTNENVSVSQVANQTVTVDDYDKVPTSPQDPIDVGVGDGSPTVTQDNPNGTTSTVVPTTSFDQGSLASATALTTTVRSYTAQQLPSGGHLQLDPADPRIQFSVSDPTNFLSYTYSFDGGNTYTASADSQAIVSVPAGAGSVIFFSVSKDDLAEAPQTVTFDWVSPPQQTVVEPEPAQTVVVEPDGPQEPTAVSTPNPIPAQVPEDSDTGDTDTGDTDTDTGTGLTVPSNSSADESSASANTDDPSNDQVTVQQGGTIPPIDINITVRQPQDQAVLGATVGDNIAPVPARSEGVPPPALFAKGASGRLAAIFSVFAAIWNFILAIAHLMFI